MATGSELVRGKLSPNRWLSQQLLTICRGEEERNIKLDLAKVDETIGRLQSSIKSILVDPEQRRLRERITGVEKTQKDHLKEFGTHIASLPVEERASLSIGSLLLFWERLPPPLDLSGRTDVDPCDGLIFAQKDIEEAETVLRTFCEAWKGEVPKDNPPWVLQVLPNMGRICLILNTMNRRELLEMFLNEPYNDNDLPLTKHDLRMCLADHDASVFLAEQYRAVPRNWSDGEHIEIGDEEPLPLLYVSHCGGGAYSTVQQVKDPYTGITYACKKQKKSEDGSSQEHFQNEITRLRDLDHPHIVQFVKSYERGTQYGMLLKPVANGDLWKLFGRFQAQHLKWIPDMLMKMFGCLTHALADIHKFMRHKDIKPQNILWVRKTADEEVQFMWADFGLAYDFGSTGDSVTQTPLRFSPRYAAPEFIKPSVDQQSRHMSGVHGRKSDIFSFGLVFLETLSLLIGEDMWLPPNPNSLSSHRPQVFQEFATKESPFSDNISQIEAWVNRQLNNPARTSELRVLFNLGRQMIQEKPEDRPDIDDILTELWKFESKFFCSKCVESMKQKRPRSPPPASTPSTIASSRNTRLPLRPLDAQLKRSRTDVGMSSRNQLKVPAPNHSYRHSISTHSITSAVV
jgi:serine/threonine protein kinase